MDFGQAQFVGTDVIIRCDEDWTCCQREQAKAKVQGYNKDAPMTLKGKLGGNITRAKKKCQARETNRLEREMKADPEQGAKDNASSPCLAEEMQKDWESGKESTSGMDVQMDHPVAAKWGGPANTTLKALDSTINHFFGGIEQHIADKMRAQGETEVTSVSMICDPPCKPPRKKDKNNSYNAGPRRTYPASPDPSMCSPVSG